MLETTLAHLAWFAVAAIGAGIVWSLAVWLRGRDDDPPWVL